MIFKQGDEITSRKLNALDRPDLPNNASFAPTSPVLPYLDHATSVMDGKIFAMGGVVIDQDGNPHKMPPASLTLAAGANVLYVAIGEYGAPEYTLTGTSLSVPIWSSILGRLWQGPIDFRGVHESADTVEVTNLGSGASAHVIDPMTSQTSPHTIPVKGLVSGGQNVDITEDSSAVSISVSDTVAIKNIGTGSHVISPQTTTGGDHEINVKGLVQGSNVLISEDDQQIEISSFTVGLDSSLPSGQLSDVYQGELSIITALDFASSYNPQTGQTTFHAGMLKSRKIHVENGLIKGIGAETEHRWGIWP